MARDFATQVAFASGAQRFAPSAPDPQLFRELVDRFTILAEACARFSQEVYRRVGDSPTANVDGIVGRNVEIARTVFQKWSIEILATTYLNRSIGLQDLKRALGLITLPLLKTRLRQLEKGGLVQREGGARKASEVKYSLTHKGIMIARLGEPVFLYLRLAEGWWKRGETGEAVAPPEEQPLTV